MEVGIKYRGRTSSRHRLNRREDVSEWREAGKKGIGNQLCQTAECPLIVKVGEMDEEKKLEGKKNIRSWEVRSVLKWGVVWR